MRSPVPGAVEKITDLRFRCAQISDSLERLEARVAENAAELEAVNEAYARESNQFDYPDLRHHDNQVTDEDIERELEEIRELERRKQVLEESVSGMSRDLGGLLR